MHFSRPKLFNLPTQSYKAYDSISHNTIEESFLKSKLPSSSKRVISNFPKITSTYYSPETTQFSSKAKNDSILSRFQRELKTQFTEEINKEISLLSHTKTTFRKAKASKCRILPHPMSLSKSTVKKQEKDQSNHNLASETKSIITPSNDPSIIVNEPSTVRLPKTRKRNFYQKILIDPKWKLELGLFAKGNQTEKCLVNDIKYQSHYIKDQVKLLLDNIQHYKVTALSSSNILSAFKNKSIKAQVNHNKLLEEQCVILNEIPKRLLGDFYGYTDKFISASPVCLKDLEEQNTLNEADCFIQNVRLLNQLFFFLKCSFDVYSILINESEDILLSQKDFEEFANTIQKARYNMNMLIATSKNWITDFNFDRNLIENVKSKLINNNENDHTKKAIQPKLKKDFVADIIHKQFNYKKSDQELKIQRINNILRVEKKEREDEENRNDQMMGIRPIKPVKPDQIKLQSLINSPYIDNIMKYCKKDVRQKIISLKTIERFNENTQ